MFVVRVENDEATMYRAFRRGHAARAWASEKNLDDVESLVDIFQAPETDDVAAAVAMARNGRAKSLLRSGSLTASLPVPGSVRDIAFGGSFAG